MNLNMLFFTITIKKRNVTMKEAEHQELVDQLYEEHKNRQISSHLFF